MKRKVNLERELSPDPEPDPASACGAGQTFVRRTEDAVLVTIHERTNERSRVRTQGSRPVSAATHRARVPERAGRQPHDGRDGILSHAAGFSWAGPRRDPETWTRWRRVTWSTGQCVRRTTLLVAAPKNEQKRRAPPQPRPGKTSACSPLPLPPPTSSARPPDHHAASVAAAPQNIWLVRPAGNCRQLGYLLPPHLPAHRLLLDQVGATAPSSLPGYRKSGW